MIKISQLRVGQHILVGRNYETFSIPKHIAKITQICEDYILCVSDPEQDDPDEYKESEIEGIKIEPTILERHGFKLSKLRDSRYFWIDPDTQARIVVDIQDGSLSANGEEQILRTGCKFLHQLESAIADTEINLSFL